MILTSKTRAGIIYVLIITGTALLASSLHAQQNQSASAWEEVMPGSTKTAITTDTSGLLNTPPRVLAAAVHAGDYRAPVEPPRKALAERISNKTEKAAATVKTGLKTAPVVVPGFESVEPEDESADVKGASISADAADADASYYDQRGGSYVVQRGDTLGKIAKQLLGSSKKWREIARANPRIDPNKLVVGQTLVIPGVQTGFSASPAPAQIVTPVQMPPTPDNSSFDAGTSYSAPAMIPSYDPPPIAPPPIYSQPPAYVQPIQPSQPMTTQPYAAVPPPPVYMPPVSAPPPPPYVDQPGIPATPPPAQMVPTAIGTRELYREERYRIPDELKERTFSPYFANFYGHHGLFTTQSALYPYIKTWHFGFSFRYDNYKYLNGNEKIVRGSQWVLPINLLYTGKKMMAGVSIPFQNWEVEKYGGSNVIKLTGLHDPEIKFGYQIWKNYEGNHAVTLHLSGKFPSDNYHQPLWTMTGKSRIGVRVGPAESTRGGWVEFGGAYSAILGERWTSHINLALANNSHDNLTKYIYRGGMDYRVNHNFSLVLELDGMTYEMDNGPDGPNVDLLLGVVLFNDHWQGTLGFPISLQSEWGYGHDYGVMFGFNHRWD